MATSTEVAIATTTLSSAASSISFNSIAADWTDLKLIVVGSTTSISRIALRFNGASTNYSSTALVGTGSIAESKRRTSDTYLRTYDIAFGTTYPSLNEIDIFSYAGNTYKTVLFSSNQDENGNGIIQKNVGLWQNTSAITSITIYGISTTTTLYNLQTGTTATLYGIL